MSSAYDSALTATEPYLLLPRRSFKPCPALTEEIREANENHARLTATCVIANEKLERTL